MDKREVMKMLGQVFSAMGKKQHPFSDKIDARMVEKFLFLNLSHLACCLSRDGHGLCAEVVEEFGQYLETKGITTKDGIGIFQQLSLLFTTGIKSLQNAEKEMNTVTDDGEKGEDNYKPNFPI